MAAFGAAGSGCCSRSQACWRARARRPSRRHRRPRRPAPAAASAPAQRAGGGERTGRARPPLPPREQYSEKGADTCLECHDDVTPGYSGAAIFKGKHAHRIDKRAPFGPGGLQCEACHGPGARHAAQQEPRIDQQPQGELVADGAGAQPDLPQLPPGGGEDRLARQHARAQRPRLRRLPPDPPGPRPGAREEQRARRVLQLPPAEAGRLPEAVHPPGALRTDGLQRLPQRARLDDGGDAEQADAQPDLLQLPRRQARARCSGSMRR